MEITYRGCDKCRTCKLFWLLSADEDPIPCQCGGNYYPEHTAEFGEWLEIALMHVHSCQDILELCQNVFFRINAEKLHRTLRDFDFSDKTPQNLYELFRCVRACEDKDWFLDHLQSLSSRESIFDTLVEYSPRINPTRLRAYLKDIPVPLTRLDLMQLEDQIHEKLYTHSY